MSVYLMLIGAPNSGKGTACRNIASSYNLYHLSTGDLFREHITNNTKLGKEVASFLSEGKMVPDDVTIKTVLEKLKENSCKKGVVFDGFPRTIPQAQAFNKVIKLNAVIYLNVKEEILIKRAINRRVCPGCNKIFALDRIKGKLICDNCGSNLIIREDANEDVAKKRIKHYKEQTEPLLEFYKNILIEVDGNKTAEEVDATIAKKLKKALNK